MGNCKNLSKISLKRRKQIRKKCHFLYLCLFYICAVMNKCRKGTNLKNWVDSYGPKVMSAFQKIMESNINVPTHFQTFFWKKFSIQRLLQIPQFYHSFYRKIVSDNFDPLTLKFLRFFFINGFCKHFTNLLVCFQICLQFLTLT